MTDIPSIQPQRAKLVLATALRKMADAIEAGEVQWVAAVALYNLEGSQKRERAFDQASGWPETQDDGAVSWILATGVLRSAYLDFEDQLMNAGAETIVAPKAFTT